MAHFVVYLDFSTMFAELDTAYALTSKGVSSVDAVLVQPQTLWQNNILR